MKRCWMLPQNIAVLTGYLEDYYPLAQYTVCVNKQEYCDRHDYHLEIIREVRPKYRDGKSHARGFTWSRLEHLLDMIETGPWKWIWTVGADTLVTNLNIPLESIIALATTPEAEHQPMPTFREYPGYGVPRRVTPWRAPRHHPVTGKKHLLICGECVSSLQADSFIMRASKESADYLKDILSRYDVYRYEPWVEQQVMMDLRIKYAAMTFIVPQWQMNSYDYRRWPRGRYLTGQDAYGYRGQWKQGDLLIHWPGCGLQERLKFLEDYKPLIER